MYLKTKFRKRNKNRLKGTKKRKYRRRSMKRGGAPYNIECKSENGQVCCNQRKEGLNKP